MRKFFENWFHSETQKDSPTKTLGFVRQKHWQKKRDTAHSSPIHKIFWYQKIFET